MSESSAVPTGGHDSVRGTQLTALEPGDNLGAERGSGSRDRVDGRARGVGAADAGSTTEADQADTRQRDLGSGEPEEGFDVATLQELASWFWGGLKSLWPFGRTRTSVGEEFGLQLQDNELPPKIKGRVSRADAEMYRRFGIEISEDRIRPPLSDTFKAFTRALSSIADHMSSAGTKEIRATKIDVRMIDGTPKFVLRLDSGDVLIVRTHDVAAKNLMAQLVTSFKV